MPGPDPPRSDDSAFLSCTNPDDNGWLIQEGRSPATRG